MKRVPIVSIAFLLLAGLAACEKDSAPEGSGELSSTDKDLFKFLPQGETAVFGGNYMKLQKFMTSQLGKATADAMEKFGPGMTKWMECFVSMRDLKLGGSANVQGKNVQLRMAFTGMGVKDVKQCADQAGFKTNLDADGKYISIELPPPSGTQGYLVLSNGARGGLTGAMSTIAREVAAHGVTVNNVLPGLMDTGALKRVYRQQSLRQNIGEDEAKRRMAESVPMKRLGEADDFGPAVAFLCSRHAGYITAQNVTVDGGLVRSVL